MSRLPVGDLAVQSALSAGESLSALGPGDWKPPGPDIRLGVTGGPSVRRVSGETVSVHG